MDGLPHPWHGLHCRVTADRTGMGSGDETKRRGGVESGTRLSTSGGARLRVRMCIRTIPRL